FSPSALQPIGLGEAFRNALKAPDRSRKAYFGLFPFRWKENWQQAFDALRGNGRPFVAPILQTLILPQAPRLVLNWADKVAIWDFRQIIACHFDSPIKANPQQFRQAFAFLEGNLTMGENFSVINSQSLPEEDCKFIRELEANLLRLGIAKIPRENI
ncbi:MAG TPA: DUF4336 domain-containing protein, partial [Candidatus Obscuribacterales bacterium]